jgi:hypothetical protein
MLINRRPFLELARKFAESAVWRDGDEQVLVLGADRGAWPCGAALAAPKGGGGKVVVRDPFLTELVSNDHLWLKTNAIRCGLGK